MACRGRPTAIQSIPALATGHLGQSFSKTLPALVPQDVLVGLSAILRDWGERVYECHHCVPDPPRFHRSRNSSTVPHFHYLCKTCMDFQESWSKLLQMSIKPERNRNDETQINY